MQGSTVGLVANAIYVAYGEIEGSFSFRAIEEQFDDFGELAHSGEVNIEGSFIAVKVDSDF